MDLLSIALTRAIYRALHPTCLIVPRVLQSKQIEEILSHTEKNKKDRRVYKVRRFYRLVIFLYGMAYMYDNLCIENKYMYTSPHCHANTRVRPRGKAMWPCVPRRIHVGSHDKCTHFANFLIVLTK